MNKRDFEKYINTQLKDVPIEKFEKEIKKMQEELKKMQQVWLPQILEKRKKTISNVVNVENTLKKKILKLKVK